MVSGMTLFACVITLVITLVLPVAALLIFALKNRKQGIVSAWLLGAAGFFVPQILIRLPLLTVLQGMPWFVALSQKNMFLYVFGLAFTAGLFELAGRFAAAKGMKRKNLTWKRALAAGLGHGSIEAMLLIGMTYVNNLLYILMINSGSFDGVLAQAAAAGVDVAQLELIRTQLVTASPGLFLLAGFERILAVTSHMAMSVLVCWGVRTGKLMPSLLACLAIHTCIDLTTGISAVLPQNIAYPVIYAILTVVAVAAVLILRAIRRRWLEKEVSYDSEK